MKKNYLVPNAGIITIALESMLVTSKDEPRVQIDYEAEPLAPEEAETRRHSSNIWDDEDELDIEQPFSY